MHLIDVGENEAEDLNVKVQHKVWAGNNDSFRVWDGVNKFVIMPSFLGVDEDAPIVDFAAERFTDVETVVAPSVNGVDGGVVLVMYLLDAATADAMDGSIIDGVINDGFRVLSSDLAKSGESMAAFAAETTEGCTGPIAATSTGEFASGMAITVALRPFGVAVSDLEDCAESVLATGTPTATSVATTTATPTIATTAATPTAAPTADATDTMGPTDLPTSPTASLPWFEPTQEPTMAEVMDEMIEPTAEPTPMVEIVPPTLPPSSASVTKTTLGIMLIASSGLLASLFL